MKFLKMFAVVVAAMASVSASADCRIVLKLCKPIGIKSATTFADAYTGSDKSPQRCLERAREYLNYCNSDQQVGAEFYVNGVLTISSYVTRTSSQMFTKTGNGLWVQILGGY